MMYPIITLLILSVIFFAISPFGSFPLNDDWVYALSALKTSETYRYTIIGQESAWTIPQTIVSAIWIKLFGFSHFKLRILTYLVAIAGLIAFDKLLVLRNVKVQLRTLAGLCIIGFFPFLPLTASSMSDIYFFTLWISACLNIELGFRNEKYFNWILGGIFIILCSLERQFGIAIAFAVLLIGYQANKTTSIKYVLASVIPLIIFCITFFIWSRLSVSAHIPIFQFPSIQERLGNLFCVLLYLGIGVFPFTFISPFWRTVTLPYEYICILFLCLFGAVVIAPWNFNGIHSSGTMPFLCNLLSRHGFFGEWVVLSGTREELFGGWFWNCYTLISIIGATYILIELWRSRQNWFKNESVTTLASLIYLVVVIITRNPLFDRYLLPPFSGLLVCLATLAPTHLFRINRSFAIGGSLALIMFSTIVTQDYFRWNEVRWAAAEWAVAQGYSASAIRGGYEWNNWNKFIDLNSSGKHTANKIIISFSKLEKTSVLKVFPYNSWIRRGHIYCLRANE